MDRSQRRDFTQQMNRTTGSYELVLSPVILALGGYGLDRWLGTTPVLTVIAAVVGLVGAAAKLVYTYNAEMAVHEANGPWVPGPVAPADGAPTTEGAARG